MTGSLDIALLVAAAVPVAALAAWAVTRGPTAMARTFRGIQPDPWPIGVQEEDRDRPWGRATNDRRDIADEPLPPKLVRVRPIVGVRPGEHA